MLKDNKGEEEICPYYTAPVHPIGVAVNGKIYATDPNEIRIENFDENDSKEDDLRIIDGGILMKI